MYLTMLKAKLHHARVTHAEREYEGSCAIDARLLEAAGIREFEQLQIYNVDNGERLSTYAIRASGGSGIISLNGAAAHKAEVGERLIICTYAVLTEQEAQGLRPTLLYLAADNSVARSRNSIPVQVA